MLSIIFVVVVTMLLHNKSYTFGKPVYFPLNGAIVNGGFSIVPNFYMDKIKLLVICQLSG